MTGKKNKTEKLNYSLGFIKKITSSLNYWAWQFGKKEVSRL